MINYNFKQAYLTRFFPALLSGFLLALAFPGANLYPLAFIGLVPLLICIENMGKKERFAAGMVAGFVHFLTLIHWFTGTMHTYGHLNILIAVSLLVLLCLYFALYFGIFSLVIGTFKFNSFTMPFFAAGLWVALEYLRNYFLTGLPWCLMGYSQYLNNYFIQIADITGIYGISFFIVLINAFFALLVINFQKERRKVVLSGISILIIFFSLFLYGNLRKNEIDILIKNAAHTKLAVVQGNIRQDVKWDKKHLNNTIEIYSGLSEKVSRENPDLIIWPETALPFYYGVSKKLSDKVDICVRKAKTSFLVGSPAFERDNEETKYFNRAYMLDKFSVQTGQYDKVHLVPLGEYVPLGKYMTFLGKLTEQTGDFTQGKCDTQPLAFGVNNAGILICLEIIFPSLSRKFVQKGADVLLTITNDAWFGASSAAEQHFSMAVFRTIENRRSLARAANTGISGFVDPKGEVLKKTQLFVEASLVHNLPILKIKSFYTIYGDIFAILCTIAIFTCFVINMVLMPRLEKKALD